MNIGIEIDDMRTIVWRYCRDFGTPQGCVVYKVNDVHPDSGLQMFTDSYANWAAMWDTCNLVGGAYCITGRGGGKSELLFMQKHVDNHEILHIFGAGDEYSGSSCNIEKCDDPWGIYDWPNYNCEECTGSPAPCIMRDVPEYYDAICESTRRHVGMVDGVYAANDGGPDPIQKCSHTALVRDHRMQIGDIFVAFTLDGSYVLSEPVSRWNSYLNSAGERILIVPNINQYRNHIACDQYIYRLLHYGGGIESETAWGGAQWQSPDHEQAYVYNIAITDTTLHFTIDHVANLIITIENLEGSAVICRPVFGQLFGGEAANKSVPLVQMLPDRDYMVRVRGYLPDQTGPLSRSVTVTVDNGPPQAPGWNRQSLDVNQGIATYEITDGGMTQYYKPTNCGCPIDSVCPVIEYSFDCGAGSNWYKTSVIAGNVNGETQSFDIDSFLTKPHTVTQFRGRVDSIWVPKNDGYLKSGFMKAPDPGSVQGKWFPINQVTLSWLKPANQAGRIETIRICHGWYNIHNVFQHETIVLPNSPLFPYSYTFEDLRPYVDHTFSIITEDEYGQRSDPTSNISLLVGGPPAILGVLKNPGFFGFYFMM